MFLLLNASERGVIHMALFDDTHIQEEKIAGLDRELLTVLDTWLTVCQVSLDQVRGVAVLLAAGSFTSTRIATVIANTLAYTKRIPVLGVSKEDATKFSDMAARLKMQPVGQYLSATYSAEANIGKK